MRQLRVSFLLALSLAFLVVLAGSGARTPASAADCGDGVGPCDCGDTVISDTTLDPGDPVTFTVCPCDGLIVASGVELNLGGHTLRGSGVCVGINIAPFLGSFAVVVSGGRVAGFGTGVAAIVEGGGTRLHDLQVVDNSDRGVYLLGFDNVVEDCIVSRNGGPGIELSTGNDPPGGGVVQRCRVEDNEGHGVIASFRGLIIQSNIVRRNAGHGIDVGSGRNTVSLNRVESNWRGLSVGSFAPEFGQTSVTRNVVLRNFADGVEITGVAVVVDRNQSKYNSGEGFTIAGSGHTVTLNSAVSNGEDGYTVSAIGTTFRRNIANYNGRAENGQPADGYGILDTTDGGGTGGTANTYSGNGCTGNGLGNSSPTGLCF